MALGESGGVQWFMKIQKAKEDDIIFRPTVYFKHVDEDAQIGFRACFSIRKPNGRRRSYGKTIRYPEDPAFSGEGITISEVLEDPDHWLNDGAITVQYGIHVESMKLCDGIWKFNFKDEFFDPEKKWHELTLMFSSAKDETIDCSKQIVLFHSPVLAQQFSNLAGLTLQLLRLDNSYEYSNFEKCLQIAHGVRLRNLENHQISRIIGMAKKLKLQNVIRYCEQELIENEIWPADSVCIYNERYVKHFLKKLQSVKRFKRIYRSCDVCIISSKVMMMILEKFMETDF